MQKELPRPEGLVKYEEKIAARNKAKQAGRLYRVKHQAFGQITTEAESESEAIVAFTEKFCPAESKNAEWLKRFSRECRVAKVKP
jgi:hypothetical protein